MRGLFEDRSVLARWVAHQQQPQIMHHPLSQHSSLPTSIAWSEGIWEPPPVCLQAVLAGHPGEGGSKPVPRQPGTGAM